MNPSSMGALIGIAMLSIVNHSQAQSSVAIYGVIDAYGQALSGASHLDRLQSGGLSGSRFGVRGQEDLGDGAAAVFVLESGVNLDDGTNGQNAFWGRQAYVGLRSDAWGQVTLGRQYSGLYGVVTDFSEFSNVAGPSTAVIGGFGGYEPSRGSSASAAGNGGPARVNNSLRYESPEWAGWRAGVVAGLGESSGYARDNRLLEAWGRYTAGPVSVMVSYLDDKGGAVDPEAAHRVVTIGARYGEGAWRAMAGYLSVDDRSAADEDGSGWWLGCDYTVGRQTWKAQYVQSKPASVPDSKTQALGVGWEYALSKRSTLYTSLSHFRNGDLAGLGRAWFAVPSGLTTLSHNDIDELVGGMRLTF